jgi:hypothetical protein
MDPDRLYCLQKDLSQFNQSYWDVRVVVAVFCNENWSVFVQHNFLLSKILFIRNLPKEYKFFNKGKSSFLTFGSRAAGAGCAKEERVQSGHSYFHL